MLTGSVDSCAEIKRVPLQCHRKAMLGLWRAPQRPLDLTYGDDEVMLNVLRRMSVDILGTSCDQCRSTVQ